MAAMLDVNVVFAGLIGTATLARVHGWAPEGLHAGAATPLPTAAAFAHIPTAFDHWRFRLC
jgi:hypothetical protein